MPDVPEPTSFGLTKGSHADASDICKAVSKALNLETEIEIPCSNDSSLHDVPGDWFKGPF